MGKKYALIFSLCLLFVADLWADCTYDRPIYGEELEIGTLLHWSTSMEDDNSMFVVEKSVDGLAFEEIGNVEGAGDSKAIKRYRFLDVMANKETTFYRLKQIDFDGSWSHSDILRVTRTKSNNFVVVRMSAVATPDYFTVSLNSFKEGSMNYQLHNWKGEPLEDEHVAIIDGYNELNFDLRGHKDGIYKVIMIMEDESETLVIKRILSEDEKRVNVASSKKLGEDQ